MEKKVILSSEVLHQIGAIDVTPGLRRTDGQSEWSHSFISVIKALANDAYHCEGDGPAAAALFSAFTFGSMSIVTPDDEPDKFTLPKWLTPSPLESNMYLVLGGIARLLITFDYQSDTSITAFRVGIETIEKADSAARDGGITYTRDGKHVTLILQGNISASDKVIRGVIADINLSEANMMFLCVLLSVAGRCFAGYAVPASACFEIDLREISQIASDQPANIVALDARKTALDYFFNRVYRSVGTWTGVSDRELQQTHINGDTYVTVLSGGKRQQRTNFCFDRLAAQMAVEDRQDLATVEPENPNDERSRERDMQFRIAQALPGTSPAKVATLTAGVLALASMFDDASDEPTVRAVKEPLRETAPQTPSAYEHDRERATAPSDPEQVLFETTASRRARNGDQSRSSLEQLLDNEVFFS